ncbi:MAG: hypothetical protein CVV37_06095 [Nitrospira bacterium HGW-Nitrospira-1]|nr:MAG: hypothetical protein CVV37_06095 [Nitrospira bacterium HGW-Nitrospira-1]
MAEVVPFKGVLFNIPKISKVSGEDLLAPPYDIITPEYRETLYNKSPYNIVRIDFGKELPGDDSAENKYTRAQKLLEAWLKDGVLITSPTPCFYSYELSYKLRGKEQTLRGFLGLVRLEELGKGNIHPHECTHSKPKQDRLDLMRICRANISPIFSLYNSPDKKTSLLLSDINKTQPCIDAKDSDGAVHRLWAIEDSNTINIIKNELEGKAIFIADGHHRYETALEYRKEMREKEGAADSVKPYDYVLMFLANISDEGLTILSTHRLVKNLPPDALDRLSSDFEIQQISGSFDIADSIAGKKDVFGLYKGGDSWYKLSYRGEGIADTAPALKNLDVTILHELIFRKLGINNDIFFEMDVNKCINLVRENNFNAAFFLNPTQIEDVERVALASLRMPPKSTYFYPKLLTGLVLNIF